MSIYEFEIKPELEKKLAKLCKKDKPTYKKIMKKIYEIIKIHSGFLGCQKCSSAR